MCNLYTNKSTVQEMANLFRTPATYGFNAPADVYPQYPGIVVREDQGQRILQQMNWGFPRHSLNKRTGKPNKPTATNNARDDKLWTIGASGSPTPPSDASSPSRPSPRPRASPAR